MDEITPAAPPAPEPPNSTGSLPFRRPADYYSSPVGEARPIFPSWVPYGCGTAAIVVLIVVFLGGIFAAHGGMGKLLDFMFGSMQTEIEKMFTKSVPASARTDFEQEMKTMRDSVRQNRVPIEKLQPLLRDMRDFTSDQHVTPAEVQQLIKEMHEINTAPPGRRGPSPSK